MKVQDITVAKKLSSTMFTLYGKVCLISCDYIFKLMVMPLLLLENLNLYSYIFLIAGIISKTYSNC